MFSPTDLSSFDFLVRGYDTEPTQLAMHWIGPRIFMDILKTIKLQLLKLTDSPLFLIQTQR